MTRRSAWLDPTSTQAAVALAILAALANGVWLLIDNSIPSWDQSHYLSITLQYQHALDNGGPIDLLRSIHTADPSHGPLFTVLMLPLFYIFGAGASAGLILNLLVAPILYFSAGEIAWVIFRSWVARLLTIALVAMMPLLVGLFHNVLQDFLLVTLATLSMLLLLKSEGFQRRGMTLAMALTMALGTLTKVTFPLFVIGPLLVVVAQVLSGRIDAAREDAAAERASRRGLLITLAGALLVFLVVAFAWYGPTFSETIEYVRSTTGGPLSEGAGPTDPYTFHAIASFTLGVIDFNLSWLIALLGLFALVLNAARLKALFTRPLRPVPLWKLAFLLAWTVIPYLSVALAHNQDVRLMAPALPGVAVLVAGAVAAVPRPRARLALVGAAVAVAILAYQTLNHVTDVTPGFAPERLSVASGDYQAQIELGTGPIGEEQLPADDYTTPVVEFMEKAARGEPGGFSVPRMVCMLESEATMNTNTLNFISAVREDPFLISDVMIGLEGEKGLESTLSECDFAIYVKQPEISRGGVGSRLEIVNAPYAANHMTPRLFELFRGPGRSFPLLTPSQSPGEPGYLSAAGGDRVRVLVRTAPAT